MGKYVPIRFNDAEETLLQRSFAVSGDLALSTHIKRVYFDALRPNTDALQSLRRDLEVISSVLERNQSGSAAGADAQLMLSLLCGTYLMLRRSVAESVRSQADQWLDVSAIESYLRGP